jgi:hypothetical protein
LYNQKTKASPANFAIDFRSQVKKVDNDVSIFVVKIYRVFNFVSSSDTSFTVQFQIKYVFSRR